MLGLCTAACLLPSPFSQPLRGQESQAGPWVLLGADPSPSGSRRLSPASDLVLQPLPEQQCWVVKVKNAAGDDDGHTVS